MIQIHQNRSIYTCTRMFLRSEIEFLLTDRIIPSDMALTFTDTEFRKVEMLQASSSRQPTIAELGATTTEPAEELLEASQQRLKVTGSGL